MGDIRNKIAKIERAKRDRADMESWLRANGWVPKPPRPPDFMLAMVCRTAGGYGLVSANV
jgi:hypothetical protein